MIILMSIAPFQMMAKMKKRNQVRAIEILHNGNNDSTITSKKYIVSINNETGYGMLPFNYTRPYSGFFNRSYLQIDIDAFIPLQISFDYNTPYFGGLNYTYNLSLNKQRLKEKLQNNSVRDIEKLKRQLNILQDMKSTQTKKLIFLNKKELVYQSKKEREKDIITIDSSELQNHSINIEGKNDSLMANNDLTISSSETKLDTLLPDTTIKVSSVLDQHKPDHKKVLYNDSLNVIRNEKKQIESSLDSLNKVLGEVEKQLEYYEKGIPHLYFSKLPKKRLSLQSLKNLNVGLFSPDHQTLMMNNIQINGANVEFENKYYFSFVHGKVVDPFLAISEELNSGTPGFSAFNPFKSESGKTISVIKAGIGGVKTSHIHLGILLGKNNLSLYNENNSTTPFIQKIKNTVLEFDVQYLYKKHEFSFQAAKSLVQSSELEKLSESGTIESLINSKYSSAFGVKYRGAISKTQTFLIFSSSYSQPYFKSYASYIQNLDVMKNELQVNQVISSKLKLKAKYKREISNIMKLNDYKADLENYTLGINYRLNRRTTFIWNVIPVRYRASSSEQVFISLFQVANGLIINYIPNSKSVFHNISGSLNHFYNSYGENEIHQTYDVSVKDMIRFKNDLLVGIQGRYSQVMDISNHVNHLYSFSIDGEKKVNDRLTLFASVSSIMVNSISDFHLGYQVRSTYSLFKNFEISFCMEKYLFYGYMDSYINNSFVTDPYSISLKTNIVF